MTNGAANKSNEMPVLLLLTRYDKSRKLDQHTLGTAYIQKSPSRLPTGSVEIKCTASHLTMNSNTSMQNISMTWEKEGSHTTTPEHVNEDDSGTISPQFDRCRRAHCPRMLFS